MQVFLVHSHVYLYELWSNISASLGKHKNKNGLYDPVTNTAMAIAIL